MMCCFNFGKKVFSFALTFSISLSIINFLQNETDVNESKKQEISVKEVVSLKTGIGFGSAANFDEIQEVRFSGINDLRIISNPKANYTETARQHQIQGSIYLRITFLANGQIGTVVLLHGLPYGLTEQAIAAAREIEFEPALAHGKTVPVTKYVHYNFSIY